MTSRFQFNVGNALFVTAITAAWFGNLVYGGGIFADRTTILGLRGVAFAILPCMAIGVLFGRSKRGLAIGLGIAVYVALIVLALRASLHT
jgi:hypothetical protein